MTGSNTADNDLGVLYHTNQNTVIKKAIFSLEHNKSVICKEWDGRAV